MDNLIQAILFEIPPTADYAADAFDLDAEDIPLSRVLQVEGLLKSDDEFIQYTAARLLTSWGYELGLNILKSFENIQFLGFID